MFLRSKKYNNLSIFICLVRDGLEIKLCQTETCDVFPCFTYCFGYHCEVSVLNEVKRFDFISFSKDRCLSQSYPKFER